MPQLWKTLLAVLVGFLLAKSAWAATVASDSASDPAYSFAVGGAWTGLQPTVNENPPGTDNGGYGFMPWIFAGGAHDATASPYGRLNHFIDGVDFAPSLFNNLGSPAFGLTNTNISLSGFTARASRVFSQPLAVGGKFQLEFDNAALAPLANNVETGYIIRLNSGGGPRIDAHPDVRERLGFFATHGFNQGNWNRTDAMGVSDTGMDSSATLSGAIFQVTLQTPESYRLEILPLGGGPALYSATGNLANQGAGDIDTVEVVLFGNGSGNGLPGTGGLPTGQRELFFDNFMLDNPLALLTGDYNRNGTVDAADYVVWRRTLNQTVPVGEGADGNGDGVVNQLDYVVWRQHFGASAAGFAAALSPPTEIPEPSTISALCLAIAVTALRSWSMTGRNGRSFFPVFAALGVTCRVGICP